MRTCLKKSHIFHGMYRFWSPLLGNSTPFTPDETLARLYIDICSVQDKSLHSFAIASMQSDLARTHYLSAQRCNILRPFETFLRSGIRVLELGCECGAISRYLGECGAQVFSVENNAQKASVAAQRCRDCGNVAVLHDSMENLPLSLGKFDIVTLVEGLQASPGVPDTHYEVEQLKTARKFLRNKGILVLAVPNCLGLKQFAGVPGSSAEPPWARVTGSVASEYKAYSRRDIDNFLQEAGFTCREQFVPVTDYKYANTVIMPAGLHYMREHIDFADIVDVSQPLEEDPAIFNLQAAWHNIIRAGLAGELAETVCYVATPAESLPDTVVQDDVLALHFGNLPNAEKKFGKDVIVQQTGATAQVRRRPWFPNMTAPTAPVQQVLTDEPFHKGRILLRGIRQAMLQPDWEIPSVAETFRPWIQFLRDHATPDTLHVPGNFLDCGPGNIIVRDDGTCVAFDLEWQCDHSIPLAVVLVRGIYITLERLGTVAKPADIANIFFGTFIQKIAAHFGWHFSEDELANIYDHQNILENFLFPERPAWDKVRTNNLKISLGGMKKMYELVNQCNMLQRKLATGNPTK